MLVGIGIFVSRVFGVVREIFKAKYLGATGTIAGDAFAAAFRIPNFLQNMLGEGALSSSFIPVYKGLLASAQAAEARGDVDEARARHEDACRLAGAIAGALSLGVAIIVLVGVTAAPWIVKLIVWGFSNDPDPSRYLLTVQLTRIFFPGAALFVLSAWCLAILNSHEEFLFSYLAPVMWNIAMIVAFGWYGAHSTALGPLAVAAAWGSVIGAALQFLVQLPWVLRLVPGLRISFGLGSAHVRTVLRNLGPSSLSRGGVQVSAFIDQEIAALLPRGSVALLASAQTVSTLPVSLFGMAVSAAELTAMSSVVGSDEVVRLHVRTRLEKGLRTIAFLVIPSAVAFFALGDVIIRLLFQHGKFTQLDTLYAWGILAGSAVGLVASTLGRLYAQGFFALHDTRRPMQFALVRVALTVSLGWVFAIPLPHLLGISASWGGAGLTASAGMAGWVEFTLLRRGLAARIGPTPLDARFTIQLWALSVLAAAVAVGVQLLLVSARPLVQGPVTLLTYAVVYGLSALALGIPEAKVIGRRFGIGR